jgi:carbamate kinase
MSPFKGLKNSLGEEINRAKGENRRGCHFGMRKLAVYALGGNALAPPTKGSDVSAEVLAKVMSDIIDLLEMDWRVVITHGNGPQVGHLLALDEAMSHTLDEWVAATQGIIGHQLSMNLQAILERRRRPERTAVVLTRVVVDSKDEGFSWPTKPIGPVLDAQTVMSADWDIAETIAGPRRVVASPKPLAVVELDVVRQLVELQAVVICGGGGGVPVVKQEEGLRSVPAVVDKDLFSSCLAIGIEADALIISTETDAIYRNFGTPEAQACSVLSAEEIEAMEKAGEFPAGSMAPKARALREFVMTVEEGKAILCQPGDVLEALRGAAGTTITP